MQDYRSREAQALLAAGEYSGAYYLAGYSVECALKACIAKKTKRYDFPDRKIVNDLYTHDLAKLATLADLNTLLNEQTQTSEQFYKNWQLVKLWSEASRYRVYDKQTAEELVGAIISRRRGVMPWVRQHR